MELEALFLHYLRYFLGLRNMVRNDYVILYVLLTILDVLEICSAFYTPNQTYDSFNNSNEFSFPLQNFIDLTIWDTT